MNKHKVLLWVDADDCDPPHGLDMQSKHDYLKVAMLAEAFVTNGFDRNCAALVGYPLNGRIQLLSGTHRHLAAKQAKTKLPVTLWLRSYVEALWGTEQWDLLIEDISVNNLLEYEQIENKRYLVENSEEIVFDY
jgi:hypothetical protein